MLEAKGGHDANAKPPPLNSDQLNYLIWRFVNPWLQMILWTDRADYAFTVDIFRSLVCIALIACINEVVNETLLI